MVGVGGFLLEGCISLFFMTYADQGDTAYVTKVFDDL